MNNQIKLLRKELGLTMQEFGKNLGVSKSAISNIENGYNSLTDQMISSICNAYNVNEEWLRNGTGEMFVESSDSLIEKIVSKFPLDKLSQTILRTYIELEPKEREVFNHVMKVIANNIMEEGKEEEEIIQEKIDKEVEAYRRELEIEARIKEKSYPLDDTFEENENKKEAK